MADDPLLDRRVAVKILRDDRLTDPASIQMLESEAKKIAKLHHPNIVAVFDAGREEDFTYVVMEYVEGQSLREQLMEGPMDGQDAYHIIRGMCQGVSFAHEKGVVHKDLKPRNVMLEESTHRVVVMDFGLASMEGEVVDSERIVGSPAYMSPEQIKGESLDRRTDIHAIGVILYEMFTGHMPFQGTSAPEVLRAVLRGQFAPPSQLNSEIGPAFETVITTCMALDKGDRYQTLPEMVNALQSCPDKLPPTRECGGMSGSTVTD